MDSSKIRTFLFRHFTEAEVDKIKNTTFKDVIMAVTEINSNQLQDDVFFVTNGEKSYVI